MRKPAGFLCALALTLALGAKLSTTVTAQANDLPLLYSDGLQYVGGFRLPAESVNGESFAFGGSSIAFNPAGNSLFVSCGTFRKYQQSKMKVIICLVAVIITSASATQGKIEMKRHIYLPPIATRIN